MMLRIIHGKLKPGTWDSYERAYKDVMAKAGASRSEQGQRLIFDENFFVETVLPRSIIRHLSEAEMDAYRKPFLRREARVPTLVWPRELPIEGEPADVVAVVDATAHGWRARKFRSSSSTPIRARCSLDGLAMSAVDGPTSEKSPSRASITSRRIRRRRSAPP